MVTRRKTRESAATAMKVGRCFRVAGCLLAFLMLPVAAYGAEPTAGKQPWEVEWDKAVAAARKEGKLIAEVSSDFVRNYRPLIEHFERKFGIKVTLQGGGRGRAAVNRIVAEAGAGLYNVDYFGQGTTSTEVLIDAGLVSPVAELFILPEVKDQSLWYGRKHWYSDRQQRYSFQFVATHRGADMAINTNLINPDEITSFWDLLKPKYRGLIVTGFIGEAGQAGSIQEWYGHPELGPEFLRRLVLETGMAMVADRETALDWLITGKKGIMFLIGDLATPIREVKKFGAPVERLTKDLKEGAAIAGGGGGVMLQVPKRAPRPNAGKVFTNWFLSKEGQLMLQHANPARDSLRIDIPKDMVNPGDRRRENLTYMFPGADPKFQALRVEALEFAKDLTKQWREQQRRR